MTVYVKITTYDNMKIFFRQLHCSYHCIQVLSARVLLFMTQSDQVQDELLQEQQLRILAATLDSTHDPVSNYEIFDKIV